MNELVSVIVPVYNTKIELLKRCVDSICAQTYKNLEIIIVLNGNTPEYCSEVRRTLPKTSVRIREVEKAGPSFARNTGLELARGEFIAFSDADDEVAPTYIENALKILKSTDADVAAGGYKYQFDEYERQLSYNGDLQVLQGQDVCRSLLTATEGDGCGIDGFLFYSVCGKLYRRGTLEKLRFLENVSFYEDMLFVFSVADSGAVFALSNEIWYTYYQYSHSLLHNRNDRVLHDFPEILCTIDKKITAHGHRKTLCGDFGAFILWCIRYSIRVADGYAQYVSFVKRCESLSQYNESVTEYGGKADKVTRFHMRHRLYRIYYGMIKLKHFISKIKNGKGKTDKLIITE